MASCYDTAMTVEEAKSFLEGKGYRITLPIEADSPSMSLFRREATPFPCGSRSPSDSPLSDAPDSDGDPEEHPPLSRRASNLSLPDASPLPIATPVPIATPTTAPSRRSSMRQKSGIRSRRRRKVRFDDAKNTQVPPPTVKIVLLQAAHARCKKFVFSYAAIHGLDDGNRPKQCHPMFHLNPPPFLSADEKVQYVVKMQCLVEALNFPKTVSRGLLDRYSRARRGLWGLWFASRDEWLHLGKPDVDFDSKVKYMTYDRSRHCHLNDDGTVFVR